MSIKTTMRYHLTPFRAATIKGLPITNAREGVERREPSYIVGANVSWCSLCVREGFSGGTSGKEPACQCKRRRDVV